MNGNAATNKAPYQAPRWLKLKAYTITRNVVESMTASPNFPPPSIFRPEDLEDTISDVYCYVLTLLPEFDSSQSKLLTFLYLPVKRRAHSVAWRLTKGGITGCAKSPVVLEPLPLDADEPTGEDDFNPEATEIALALTYPEPPEGLEVPGRERPSPLEKLRELLQVLPADYRERIEAHYLSVAAKEKVVGAEIPQSLRPWYIRRAINNALDGQRALAKRSAAV